MPALEAPDEPLGHEAAPKRAKAPGAAPSSVGVEGIGTLADLGDSAAAAEERAGGRVRIQAERASPWRGKEGIFCPLLPISRTLRQLEDRLEGLGERPALALRLRAGLGAGAARRARGGGGGGEHRRVRRRARRLGRGAD